MPNYWYDHVHLTTPDPLKTAEFYEKMFGAKRDILLVDVARDTGLRRSELANLTVGNIDIERQLLIVHQGKGQRDRIVPLTNYIAQRLEHYIEGRGKEESLFGLVAATISGKIKHFADKAGVKLHTHSLRDSFATTLLERGATIREVQELLGHSNLNNTERYTLLPDKHLRQAIDRLDGHDLLDDHDPAPTQEKNANKGGALRFLADLTTTHQKDHPNWHPTIEIVSGGG